MQSKIKQTKLEEVTMERIKNFFNDESGAAAVEYGLLVAGIAVVIIVAVQLVGTNLNAMFTDVAGKISPAP
jgi:pilus assembly protein Flp/PilA